MLRQRTLTALVLAPLAVAAVIWLPPAGMAVLSALVFLVGFDEWSRLAGFGGSATRALLALLLAALLATLWHFGSTALWLGLAAIGAGWWLLSLLWLRHFSFAAAPTRENSGLKLVAGLLAHVPAWCALQWLVAHGSYGRWLLLALLIIWGADTGAYFAGSHFGKRKLAPRVSPGKTWAGVVGALALSALVAAVGGWLLDASAAGIAGLVLIALLTVVASIVGDLFESLLKRHAQVKDSGALFPGHGGVLDRMDSVLAALPVFAACLALFGP
ncbi:MAG TPA: CDP-archaeol synthase [Rhodanobacteraceae bacterium]|nr:CDP-archaeol synthase [Rhodanobacteraceae bacterium]